MSASNSHSHTFLWHDYETFGLNARRDRPAQFAGIRTDANLNEIEEPLELFCKPSADYLPSPEACLITGITPQQCLARGIAEPEFAQQIEAQLARPGTIGVGYNTIRFDDEVTRHLFWRNFIDPYAREWRNQCGRWDVLDLVRAAYALRPEGLSWPTVPSERGETRPSFKLERLSTANGIAHEAAHDAVSDVRATIALARLIKKHQPKLFDFYFALHKKDRVLAEMGLPCAPTQAKPFLHISGMFPVERGCIAVMWPLATHPTNKNEIIAWDLSAQAADDPSVLAHLRADDLRARLFSKQEDLPAGVLRLPIKNIHINKSPFVLGSLQTLTPELQKKWGIDLAQCLARAELARALPNMSAVWSEVFLRRSAAVSEEGSDVIETDAEEALYDGFIGDTDRYTLAQLQKTGLQTIMTSPESFAHAQTKAAFSDTRLDKLLWRYRARHFAQTLSGEENSAWLKHCRARLIDGAAQARTFVSYFAELDQLEAKLIEGQQTQTDPMSEDALNPVTLNPVMPGQARPGEQGLAKHREILQLLREYGLMLQRAC